MNLGRDVIITLDMILTDDTPPLNPTLPVHYQRLPLTCLKGYQEDPEDLKVTFKQTSLYLLPVAMAIALLFLLVRSLHTLLFLPVAKTATLLSLLFAHCILDILHFCTRSFAI